MIYFLKNASTVHIIIPDSPKTQDIINGNAICSVNNAKTELTRLTVKKPTKPATNKIIPNKNFIKIGSFQ